MSFFLPTENEQIQLVDNFEAESAQAPFAFSVPQEVVDEFLRSGSNTADHRMKVTADFAKQLSPETIAQRLPRIYHGGFGMMYMANRTARGMTKAAFGLPAGKAPAMYRMRSGLHGRMLHGASGSCWNPANFWG